MKNDVINLLIVAIIVAVYITLDKLGLSLISQIYKAAVATIILIVSLKVISDSGNKIHIRVISVNIILGLIMIFVLFFVDSNEYLLWGSAVCFLISFPIGILVITIYQSRGKF
ncbi:hypothetical protein [Clostridium sp. CF012]|uniref:hypothetical protein n=1 Tax=Clostridium sp. CF012 TaxID=2843319 RepID=UPI001C0C9625|nr:hypothetical protein [Clostridium sp. CF012]MBU3145663.1 hypothetical protein [Clostridium sp. CF012]